MSDQRHQENDGKSPARLLGGFLRMEIGLGSVVNMLIIVGTLAAALMSYDADRALEQRTVAILEQRFSDFETTTLAQLATINAQTANMPVARSEIATIDAHISTVDTRLDRVEGRVGALEQSQATQDAEIAAMRGSRVR